MCVGFWSLEHPDYALCVCPHWPSHIHSFIRPIPVWLHYKGSYARTEMNTSHGPPRPPTGTRSSSPSTNRMPVQKKATIRQIKEACSQAAISVLEAPGLESTDTAMSLSCACPYVLWNLAKPKEIACLTTFCFDVER